MALSILLHPPTALWRREALAASRGTFWVRMDGASSLRIYNPHGRDRSHVVELAGFRHDHAPAASQEGPDRVGRFDLLDRLSAVVAECGRERRAAQRADAAAGWHARRGGARDALRRLLAVDARIDELEHPELHRED